jgi:phenylalanyl-tRNA synthetase beta chain
VLLESAWFEPTGVRRTARRHGLHTEASHRFERGVDPEGVVAALDRCAAMIAELSGGVVRRGAVDVHPRRRKPVDVVLPWARPGEVLGMPVTRKDARTALLSLGFELRATGARNGKFRVPSWRLDVTREEDLIEEIVRLRGYGAIPETLPPIVSDTPAPPREAVLTERMRQALEGAGFSEAVNFSFVAPSDLLPLAPRDAPSGIPLRNPISADLAVMRSSLLPSLLKGLAYNRRQRVEDARLYEIASTYHRRGPDGTDDAPAREELRLAGVAVGRRHPVGWSAGGEPVDFHDVKGAIEAMLESLGIDDVRWSAGGPGWLHPRSAATITWTGGAEPLVLGVAGEVHPRVAAAFDLPRGVLAFDLGFVPLATAARPVRGHADVPRFPAVLRDLAVIVEAGVEARAVLDGVRSEPLVEDVTLFDVYRGAPIPEGKKNLAMAIRYRAGDRTLTDAEADAAHGRIVERLRTALGAELRG